MCFGSGTKYDSMRKELYHFLWRTKKIYTIYSGIARAYPRSLESDFRWTTRSLFYQLKRALFFMRTQPMAAGPIAHSPLAVRRKQKSKLGRSEYTRIPRVCRWNLISAAFVTKHTAVLFFHPFPQLVRLIPHYSFFAFVSQCDRGGISRERDTIFA